MFGNLRLRMQVLIRIMGEVLGCIGFDFSFDARCVFAVMNDSSGGLATRCTPPLFRKINLLLAYKLIELLHRLSVKNSQQLRGFKWRRESPAS